MIFIRQWRLRSLSICTKMPEGTQDSRGAVMPHMQLSCKQMAPEGAGVLPAQRHESQYPTAESIAGEDAFVKAGCVKVLLTLFGGPVIAFHHQAELDLFLFDLLAYFDPLACTCARCKCLFLDQSGLHLP